MDEQYFRRFATWANGFQACARLEPRLLRLIERSPEPILGASEPLVAFSHWVQDQLLHGGYGRDVGRYLTIAHMPMSGWLEAEWGKTTDGGDDRCYISWQILPSDANLPLESYYDPARESRGSKTRNAWVFGFSCEGSREDEILRLLRQRHWRPEEKMFHVWRVLAELAG